MLPVGQAQLFCLLFDVLVIKCRRICSVADTGDSVAAVSKVSRNAYGVSDAMRSAVSESIDRLSYRPSVAARGMRGQTCTLGL